MMRKKILNLIDKDSNSKHILFKCEPPDFYGYHIAKTVLLRLISDRATFEWYSSSRDNGGGISKNGFTISIHAFSGNHIDIRDEDSYGRPNLQRIYDYINYAQYGTSNYNDGAEKFRRAFSDVDGRTVRVSSGGLELCLPPNGTLAQKVGVAALDYLTVNMVPFKIDAFTDEDIDGHLFYHVKTIPWWDDLTKACIRPTFMCEKFHLPKLV